MTTTPESTKGVPRIEGNPAPSLRADHNALADWVRDNIDRSVPTAGDLTGLFAWVGRRVRVVDTGITYRHDGAAWRRWSSGWITYSPTVTGFVVGAGGGAASQFAYRFIDGRVRVKYLLVRGSSGASAGSTRFTLPFDRVATPVSFDRIAGLGVAGSPTVSFATTHSMAATSVSQIRVLYIGGSGEAEISGSLPFTWAAGHFLSGEIEYDPA